MEFDVAMFRNGNTAIRTISRLLWVVALLAAFAAQAQKAAEPAPDPNEVLVENRWAKVTRADYDAEIAKLPADIRGGFAISNKRVIDLLVRILVTKSLAAQARASEVLKQADVQARRSYEIDRVDASLLLSKVEDDAGKRFDADSAKFEARARELYLVNASSYEVPAQVAASLILIDLSKRTKEEALKLAQETRAKLVAGADFAATAKAVSDDPSAQQSGGSLGFFDREKMDRAFTDAAFALKTPGEISQPVLGYFGYYIIRLDDRKPARVRPFDEVKGEIMAQERKKAVDAQRNAFIDSIRDDRSSKINQAAVDSLMIKADQGVFDKALEATRPK
jgi:peptidyl-prolyl cis-trans isomerase C